MRKDDNFYTLLLQNNASKQFYTFDKLENTSTTNLYVRFEVELDLPEGEYTYVFFVNNRDDVTYTFKTPILTTILHFEDEDDIILRDIQPSTGLMRVGQEIKPANTYDFPDDDNNTPGNTPIFYYEG